MRAGVDIKEMSSTELLGILRAKQETFFFNEALELYIPPQVGRFVGDNESKDASETIENWLKNPDKQCLLLLGDSGAGKTLFGQWLTRQSFQNKGMCGRIPLFIPLLAQKHPEEGLVDHYLKKTCGIEDKNQREWIKQQPLLLILDGFDEIHKKVNLYRSNKLWQYKDIKIIISCRNQALANIHDYASLFYPYDTQNNPQPYQLQECVVNPFTEKQIETYLQQYVNTHQLQIKETLLTLEKCFPTSNEYVKPNSEQVEERRQKIMNRRTENTEKEKSFLENNEESSLDWAQWQTYKKIIQMLPGFQRLLSSPFVLSLVVQVLPKIIPKEESSDRIQQLQLARINLYDHFVQQWFVRQKKKLVDARHISNNCPIEEAYTTYCEKLAFAMLQNNVTSVEYKPKLKFEAKTEIALLNGQGLFSSPKPVFKNNDEDPWSKFFTEQYCQVGNDDIKLSLIRAGCPLMQIGENQYTFLHKSLLEYFAAEKLFKGAMNNANIALGLELNEKLLIGEPATLNFLTERVEQDDKLKQCLFDVLEESKYEERVQVAAANAITILNYAGVSFSQKDLRRMRVSGADLSNAILYSADLRDADLRYVSLQGAYLNNAKLGGALMEGIQFGEYSLQGENRIARIAYSPDGRYLASGSWAGNIRIWELATGRWVRTLKGSNQYRVITSLAYSPDSKALASGRTHDKNVYIWDVDNGKEIVMKGHNRTVDCVAYSPDGKKLVSGGTDKTVRLWNIEYRKEIAILTGHTSSVLSVVFSPNGKILASGSQDGAACLWDVESRGKIAVLKYDGYPLSSVAFSPSGKILASAGYNNKVCLWDIESRNMAVLEHSSTVHNISFNPDGKKLASGDDDAAHLWDVENRKKIAISKGHPGFVVFNPKGKILASCNNDKTVRFWDIEANKEVVTLEYHASDVQSVAFNINGKELVSGGCGGEVSLWDAESGKRVAIFAATSRAHSVLSIAYSPDGKTVASGHVNLIGINGLLFWDVENRKEVANLKGHTNDVTSLIFSPNGEILASGSDDATVRLWDVESRKEIAILNGHILGVTGLVFSPDGKVLASSSNDKTICLWDVKTFRKIAVLKGHTKDVRCVTYSPDGKILASGGGDTMRFWDALSYKPLSEMKEHTGILSVNNLAFSPDSKIIVSGSGDNAVRFWEINTGKCLNVLKLKFRVKTFVFKKEEEKTYLCIGSGTEIYCFKLDNAISKLDLTLCWVSGYTSLATLELEIGGVVGLSEANERLLKQHGALGILSRKKTEDILEVRRHAILYNPKQPPHNIFSEQYFVMPGEARVTMARKKADKGSEHVFLVIEYINESNFYTITKADFYLDQTQKHSKGIIFTSGQALIEICTKSLSDMQVLAAQCVYKCWKITDDQLYVLLGNLEGDRQDRIAYWNMGNSTLYSAIESGTEKHNCLTWCEGHLAKIGIDISEQKSWLDVIVAHPQYHLQNEEEPTSKGNCLMM